MCTMLCDIYLTFDHWSEVLFNTLDISTGVCRGVVTVCVS